MFESYDSQMTTINQISSERTLKQYFGIVVRGFQLCSSVVVPGVSVGTMAFILDISAELIDAIQVIDLKVIRFIL